MTDIQPTLVVDAAPPMTVSDLLELAIDVRNGRVLAGTRRGPRAFRLDDGVEDLAFEGDGLPGVDHSFALRARAGRMVALVERELVSWDTTTGRIVSRATLERSGWVDGLSDDAATAVVILATDDGPLLHVLGGTAQLALVDVATARIRRVLAAEHEAAQLRGTAFLADGSFITGDRRGRLVVRSATGDVIREHGILDPELAQAEAEQPNGDSHATDLALLEPGAVMVRFSGRTEVRSRETGARLWDFGSTMLDAMFVIEGGRRILRNTTIQGSTETVVDAATGVASSFVGYGPIEWHVLTEDEGLIACADRDGRIVVLRRGAPSTFAEPLDRLPSTAESIAVSPDGAKIVVGCNDGAVRLIEGGRVSGALAAHSGAAGAASFLDDRVFFTASSDHLRAWRSDGSLESETTFMTSSFNSPVPSPAGRFLVGTRDGSITVREGRTGALHLEAVIRSIPRMPGSVLDDGKTFFVTTDDGFLRWDLAAGVETARLAADRIPGESYGQSYTLTPSADGARVLLHSEYCESTWLWEPAADVVRPVAKLHRALRAVFAAGRVLAVGRHDDDGDRFAPDSRIHVFELANLTRTHVLTGARSSIRALGSAGERLAAVDDERRVCLWRLPF